MCGSLRRERQTDLIAYSQATSGLQVQWGKTGDSFKIVLENGQQVEAMFNGHAQREKQNIWKEKGWMQADLAISGYTEGYPPVQYSVPSGSIVKVMARKVGVEKWVFNVVTRPAEGDEQKVHNRFPVLVRKRY